MGSSWNLKPSIIERLTHSILFCCSVYSLVVKSAHLYDNLTTLLLVLVCSVLESQHKWAAWTVIPLIYATNLK